MPRQKRPRDQDDDADEYSQSYAERHADSRHREDTPPRTQYEILRDQNFEHLQHEELDDELVTPHVTGQSSNGAPGQVAENGIIESVTCFNFMCHTKLHVELGPLINFVVGENGSGKSAVLTALTLCLGAKPGSTNRGGNLRVFIKEGQDSSMVRVKLKNKGSGAYQHDVYGDSIIVERHFNKTGTSGFRLKNVTGSRTISTKRQAVDEIVEHFCLQVDNPLNILSQDMARQFLNSASPAQKYKYFVQGVQLEALDHDYKLVEEILENIEEKLQTHDSHLGRLKAEADKAHNLATIVREHEKMREDLRSMRIRLVWSQVIDMEKEITELEERIQFENNAITQLEAALEDANRNIDMHLDRNRKFKEDRERVNAEAMTFTSEVESAETSYQGYQTEINALHSDERIVRANWQRAKEDISKLRNDIKEEQERLNHATGDARMIKQQELDETQDEYSLKKQDLSEFRAGKPLIQQNIEECQQKISEQEQVVAAKAEQLRNLDEEINRLRRHNGNFLDAYPPNTKRLLDAIERESGWHQKPLGPIGRLVALKRPEWSASIEKFLGATPLAFLVVDKADMDRLRRLMASCQVKGCPIIKAFDQTLDMTGKEPSSGFDTILRVLEFDNIKVRDVLIMNHTIEQTVLIKERRTAEEVMLSEDHETKVNIAAVMTFHDHPNQRGNGLIIQSRGGNHSTTPIERYNGPPRLRSDAEAQLQERYKLRQHLDNEYTSLKNQLNDLNEQLYRHRADLDSHERRVKQFEATIRSLTNKITDIEGEMDQFDGSDHRLHGLFSRLNEAENSERHNGLQFGAMRVRMTELKEQAAEAKKLMDEKKLELGEFQAKISKIDARIDSNTQAMRAVVAAKQSHERDLARHEAEVNSLNLECGKKRDDRDTMEAEARNTFPERVELEEGENFKTLYARFRALRSRLESVMAELGASAEVICQREAETMERYQKSKALTEELLTMQEKMRGALSDRIERWRYFQRHLSARTRVNFAYLLTERGYHGKMTIDHRAKILTLQVEPDQNRKSSEGRNTSTLSGGEKSFSSVCMLLSIWEAMGSSIRCLDEFDVFMDNVNRAISTNMLISAARRSVSRQYILITPNAIEGRAQLDKDVKIIRLTDPRQRRIDQM